jgi:hypothetical protein
MGVVHDSTVGAAVAPPFLSVKPPDPVELGVLE